VHCVAGVGQDQPRTGRSETAGQAERDTAGTAGDECDLVIQ